MTDTTFAAVIAARMKGEPIRFTPYPQARKQAALWLSPDPDKWTKVSIKLKCSICGAILNDHGTTPDFDYAKFPTCNEQALDKALAEFNHE